jgi:2',3'-cyclic-nucleotide 2'-phosphodiesterase (5'-nucleotidase family)
VRETRTFLDAFADARRTWDDLVTLQPDIVAASGHLGTNDLLEFERRVAAHREAIDMLADALATEPVQSAE